MLKNKQQGFQQTKIFENKGMEYHFEMIDTNKLLDKLHLDSKQLQNETMSCEKTLKISSYPFP